jgi:cephalosporin hydroxylase
MTGDFMAEQYQNFKKECAREIEFLGADFQMRQATRAWLNVANQHKYSYHFEWMGRPIIQYPQDVIAMQEIIWRVQPDLIIETGIAHGGSLVFNASQLAQLDLCDAIENGQKLDPKSSRRKVLGIDIDIRPTTAPRSKPTRWLPASR